jgi:AcrR family transcriptional regulator
MARLSRSQQAARTRARVLASAADLFREKGFHGATVDDIAEAAGFSKGAVYSQFGGKDDLFLALIEDRVGARAERMLDRLRSAPEGAGLRQLWEQARADRREDLQWELVLLEFRVHAARDPDLNRRFAGLHARRLEAAAAIFRTLASRSAAQPTYLAVDFARFVAALDSGGVLEEMIEAPGSAYELSHEAVLRVFDAHAE